MVNRVLIILIFATLMACNNDNDIQPVVDNVPSLSATVGNNLAFVVKEDSVKSVFRIDAATGIWNLAIYGRMEQGGEIHTLAINISGKDYESVAVGSVFSDFYSDFPALGSYGRYSPQEESLAVSRVPDGTFCTITKIDHDKKIISGTFSVVAGYTHDYDQLIEITNGVFNAVPYNQAK